MTERTLFESSFLGTMGGILLEVWGNSAHPPAWDWRPPLSLIHHIMGGLLPSLQSAASRLARLPTRPHNADGPLRLPLPPPVSHPNLQTLSPSLYSNKLAVRRDGLITVVFIFQWWKTLSSLHPKFRLRLLPGLASRRDRRAISGSIFQTQPASNYTHTHIHMPSL